ncbi:MAG: S-layer homology domain-containing protein [Thermosynechococcaceae cyanobacterium MS004]|nr:S-layer homology domain-containing protein [Thermosynechococcaceae cyanobacterium MS004]
MVKPWANERERSGLSGAWVVSILLALGLVGCDRTALQQAFSADPKAIQSPNSQSPNSETLPPVNPGDSPSPPLASPSSTPSPISSPVSGPAAPSPGLPTALQQPVKDVLQLGNTETPALFKDEFNPNAPILRGTFARWLVVINNRIYRDRPALQIRLVANPRPVFQDVPVSHPDFAYIQGLAEAGYLPSPLSGDSSQTRFRPSEPLTRETLLLWKVPVDRQQILPTVSAERVKQLWGFKDTSRIAPASLSAVAADRQNGDLSNIRRLFGSTLLFQPQKPVLQAEAAASLWFIGIEGESLSAQDLLRAEQQARSQSPDASSASPPGEASSDTSFIGPQRSLR